MLEFFQAYGTWIVIGVFLLIMLWMHGGLGQSHAGHGSHGYTDRPDDDRLPTGGHAGHSAGGSAVGSGDSRETGRSASHRHHGGC